jgi:hypothetical protein
MAGLAGGISLNDLSLASVIYAAELSDDSSRRFLFLSLRDSNPGLAFRWAAKEKRRRVERSEGVLQGTSASPPKIGTMVCVIGSIFALQHFSPSSESSCR